MDRTEEEREFRRRPRKPRLTRSERAGWSSGFKLLLHYARGTSKKGIRRAHAGNGSTVVRPFQQCCAVRLTYLKNKIRGQWRAHGRYLARESAVHGKAAGFSRHDEAVDIASQLESWQKSGHQRLWKLIISSEFGEKVDLTRLTRDLMQRMTTDLKTNFEWVAVEHYNTEHPHVHIVLRGLRGDGEALRMRNEARSRGELRVNSFVRLRNVSVNGTAALDVEDLGNAESLLSNRRYFTAIARKLLNGGIMPNKGGWEGGWGDIRQLSRRQPTETSRREQNTLTGESERKRRRERSIGR